VEEDRARTLLQEERYRLQRLIALGRQDADSDRAAAGETGDIADPAERLVAEGLDDAVVSDLEGRLEAVARAEKRLEEGTYGRSVRSGIPIPDERLEADPAAELTVEEASQQG
jgi:DnaK suppressor protein